MVAASRQNLEDFCRVRGLPIEAPTLVTAAARDTAADPAQPAHPKRWASLASMAIGGIVLVAVMVLVWRLLSSRETPTPASASEPAPPQAAAPAPSPPAAAPASPAPVEPPPQPTAAPPGDPVDRREPSAAAITLATAQLCRSLATSGGWRCDPAGDSVSPGPLVFYTRIRSPRDAEVMHRWYRGDTLRRSAKLTIPANARGGYRTFSRQTVNSGADWRVEVRSASGDLLHEQRFVVR